MNTQTRRQGWRAARPGGDGNGDGMVLSSGRHLLSGLGFPSLLPFPSSHAPCRRGRPSGRALAPTPTLTTCSSSAPAWAWAWAWVASASAAPCPCPAPAVAWPGHRRVLGCRKGEERRGGGEGSWFLARSLQSVGTLHVGFSSQLHVHQLELEKTNLLLPGTLYPLQEQICEHS
uniref:Uncharacterized protein n=1 Tax=Oryza meridionalis TaxID=40149 RepID=A0A0E0FD44_9ORYZ